MRYAQRRNEPKGSVITYYDDSSLIARRTNLTVSNMVASVTSGRAVSVNNQQFASSTNQLSYQIAFNESGSSTVRVTTTFASSDEVKVSDYRYQVLPNDSDVVGYI